MGSVIHVSEQDAFGIQSFLLPLVPMPLFNFTCPACGEHVRKILPHLTEERRCPKCDAILKRTPNAPTTRVIEVRDNGLMPRQVEQLADVEEMIRERSTEPEDPDII